MYLAKTFRKKGLTSGLGIPLVFFHINLPPVASLYRGGGGKPNILFLETGRTKNREKKSEPQKLNFLSRTY